MAVGPLRINPDAFDFVFGDHECFSYQTQHGQEELPNEEKKKTKKKKHMQLVLAEYYVNPCRSAFLALRLPLAYVE